MINNIDEVKRIFLDPSLDTEIIEDNQRTLEHWQKILTDNEALLSWHRHEHTDKIIFQFKKAYKDIGYRLATDRSLNDDSRQSLYRKQDACLFMLELMSANKNPKAEIDEINRQIKAAINAT